MLSGIIKIRPLVFTGKNTHTHTNSPGKECVARSPQMHTHLDTDMSLSIYDNVNNISPLRKC